MMVDRGLCNVLKVAIGFFCANMAYTSIMNAVKYIIDEIKKEDPSFKIDGYVSLGVQMASFSVSTWFAPSAIAAIGPRCWIFIGSVGNTLYIAQFMYPIWWVLYLSCAFAGMIGAFNATAQGNYITLNSTEFTMSRNTGLYVAIMEMGQILGNLFVYCTIREERIDKKSRYILFGFMTVMCLIGACVMATLKKAIYKVRPKITSVQTFYLALRMCITRDILLLIITFFYHGLFFSFHTGIYSTTIAFVSKFKGKPLQLISTSGMLIGLGEVIGGVLFGPILGSKTIRWGRYPIVLVGFCVNIFAFTLIFLNIPNKAPLGPCKEDAYIESDLQLAFICSFFLGFGDACYMTQIMGTLGTLFCKESAPAFAIFRFVQCGAASISFIYSHLGLHFVLFMLTIFSVLGTITYCVVDIRPTFKSEILGMNSSLVISINTS